MEEKKRSKTYVSGVVVRVWKWVLQS
jgi:hypothetical protein